MFKLGFKKTEEKSRNPPSISNYRQPQTVLAGSRDPINYAE